MLPGRWPPAQAGSGEPSSIFGPSKNHEKKIIRNAQKNFAGGELLLLIFSRFTYCREFDDNFKNT